MSTIAGKSKHIHLQYICFDYNESNTGFDDLLYASTVYIKSCWWNRKSRVNNIALYLRHRPWPWSDKFVNKLTRSERRLDVRGWRHIYHRQLPTARIYGFHQQHSNDVTDASKKNASGIQTTSRQISRQRQGNTLQNLTLSKPRWGDDASIPSNTIMTLKRERDRFCEQSYFEDKFYLNAWEDRGFPIQVEI